MKIANFALILHSDSTATGNPALAFQFMAPELIPGESDDWDQEDSFNPTEMTDVYAFACIYYEVSTATWTED